MFCPYWIFNDAGPSPVLCNWLQLICFSRDLAFTAFSFSPAPPFPPSPPLFSSSSPSRPLDSPESSLSPLCNTGKQRPISPTQPGLRREEDGKKKKMKKQRVFSPQQIKQLNSHHPHRYNCCITPPPLCSRGNFPLYLNIPSLGQVFSQLCLTLFYFFLSSFLLLHPFHWSFLKFWL